MMMDPVELCVCVMNPTLIIALNLLTDARTGQSSSRQVSPVIYGTVSSGWRHVLLHLGRRHRSVQRRSAPIASSSAAVSVNERCSLAPPARHTRALRDK